MVEAESTWRCDLTLGKKCRRKGFEARIARYKYQDACQLRDHQMVEVYSGMFIASVGVVVVVWLYGFVFL